MPKRVMKPPYLMVRGLLFYAAGVKALLAGNLVGREPLFQGGDAIVKLTGIRSLYFYLFVSGVPGKDFLTFP
ncbi:hypothetical protein SDD30_13110 [Moorella naiadis]|uniref:hypothetical protein n=1 Tax=Moorella naiadis (nom. illeg.) TaxID=3093670 RepID=UPI003D9C80D1